MNFREYQQPTDAEQDAAVERARRLVDGASFILDAPIEVPALWGDGPEVIWARGESLLLCGPAGVGKTTLCGQILRARLGLATTLLGWAVAPTATKVLYLACDRPPQISRSMRRTFRTEDRATLAEKLVVWKGPPPADLARQPATLLEMARSAGADTVFIDSLKDITVKISDDEIGAGLNTAIQQALVEGVEVAALHHQTKRGAGGVGKPNTLADVYGSTWITAGAGSVLLLWGDAGDPVVELTHLKQPAEEIGPLRLFHDHATGRTSVHRESDLLTLVSASPLGLTAQAAAKTMFETDKPTHAQVEKARRKLDRYARDGYLKHRPGERGGGAARYYAITTLQAVPDDH